MMREREESGPHRSPGPIGGSRGQGVHAPKALNLPLPLDVPIPKSKNDSCFQGPSPWTPKKNLYATVALCC